MKIGINTAELVYQLSIATMATMEDGNNSCQLDNCSFYIKGDMIYADTETGSSSLTSLQGKSLALVLDNGIPKYVEVYGNGIMWRFYIMRSAGLPAVFSPLPDVGKLLNLF